MNRPKPRRPADEEERLRALRSYAILDTEAEAAYDSLVELAAIACSTSIAFISLVDDKRLWLKAKRGLDAVQISRDDSFCAHAILKPEICEVEDALDDFRFAENPFVTGEPYIRFYAGVPLIDGEGFALGAIGVADRIPRRLSAVERRALEAFAAHVVSLLELRRREERVRDFIDGSQDVIFKTDARGRFTFVNRAVHALLGFLPEALIGKNFTTVVRPEWHAAVIRHYVEQHASRTPSTYFEFPCISQDGREVWVGQHTRAVLSEGEVTAFHSIARDITSLHEAEQAKREAEQRFEAFMNNSPAVALIKDSEDRFVFLNETLARLLGKRREEIIGVRESDLVPADVHQMIRSSEEIVLKHGQNMRVVETFRTPDGEERHWLMHKFQVPGPDQTLSLGAFGVDVTDRIKLEIELADARDAAVASDRQKSEFLAMMSHEIRTPMNGVMGMLGVLLDTDLTADQRDLTQTARNSADALLSLLNDILDFSKIEAGKLEFEMHDFEVRQPIDSVIELLADSARAKSLEVRCEIDPAVPARVRGDGGRLRQVLMNLIGNAVKFTSRGRIAIRVTNDPGGGLRFDVTDTGIGIQAEARQRLFAPFVQADSSTTRRFGGTGLGLAISQRLVELMGGKIGVESTPGAGSTFSFTAHFEPAQEIVMTSIGSGPQRLPVDVPALAPRTRRGRILVAEDNAVNQKVALRQLQKLGYRADVVANGLEAVEAQNRIPYDLVLMDCHMPEMDGYAATRVIRAKEKHRVPILALTASAMAEDRAQCIAAGMDDVLTKPVRESELEAALQKWLPEKEEPALDGAAFAALVELSEGDDDFLRDVFDTYLTQSRAIIGAMMEDLQNHAPARFAETVHALNGTSRNIGAMVLARICTTAEELARGGANEAQLAALVPEIRAAHVAACAALEAARPRKAPARPAALAGQAFGMSVA